MNGLFEYRNLAWVERSSRGLQTGRVLMRMEAIQEARLDFCNWEDSRMPAYLIYLAFKSLLGEEWADQLEELHLQRVNQWKVDICTNSMGAAEYRLYTVVRDQAVCSSAMTVSDHQLETFSVFAQDAAPLLTKIIADHPPVFQPRYRNSGCYFLANFYPYPVDKKYLSFPRPIIAQREATGNINVDPGVFSAEVHYPGETSGILETIASLKCLEVIMA